MQPGPMGAPGKAPASYASHAETAVNVPSLLAPTLALHQVPEVGPVARNTSSRLMVIFTGRPEIRDIFTASSSR